MKNRIISIIIGIAFVYMQSNVVIAEILPPKTTVTSQPTINKYQTEIGAVPVINIVKPNTNGISHNKYEKFDIEEQGAVLNNAIQKTYSQIIGVQINANINLVVPAKMILNEVLTSRSNIFGALEVLGQKADIIIANAYGITVNGGKFINTGKVNLITGTPVENNINKYIIGTGNLEIKEYGLTSIGDINLVSKEIGIKGEVKGKDLQIQTGDSEYDIEQNKITSQESAEEMAIDISSSMYADRIRIVSSKKNSGIKIEDGAILVSNIEDIEINGQGEIGIKGEIKSKRDIKLKGETIVNEGGKIKAENNVEIKSKELENKSVIKNLEYTKESIITNAEIPQTSGEVLKEYEIVKGISYAGRSEIEAGNKLSINSEEVRNIGGIIKAYETEINSNKIINEVFFDTVKIPVRYTYDVYKWFFKPIYERTYSTEKEEEISIQRRGEILGEKIKITGGELTNRSSKIESVKKIEIKANNINNVVSAGQMLEIRIVRDNGKIERGGYRETSKEEADIIYEPLPSEIVGKEINIQGQEIKNESSIISATGRLSIVGNNLTNTNVMEEYCNEIVYTIRGTTKEWSIDRGHYEESHFATHRVKYPHIYTSKTAGKLIGGEIEINLSGKLSQEEYDITIPIVRPNDEESGKKIISTIEADNVKVKAKEVVNSGAIKTKNDLIIETVQDFINNDGVVIGGNIGIKTGQDFISRALIKEANYDGGSLKINRPAINAIGIILTRNGKLDINSQGNIDIRTTSILSNDDINLTARKINLESLIYDDFYWSVRIKDSSGSIAKKERVLTGTMLSYGSVYFNGLKNISGYNVIANKKIEAKSEEDININNLVTKEYLERIRKHNGGTFGTSSTDINRKTTIENIITKLEAGEDITLTSGKNIKINGSSIESINGEINLTAGKDVDIKGVLDYELNEHYREENGSLGLSGSSKTEINEKTTLKESTVKAKEGINISAGNRANILGSDLISDDNIIIKAINDINIGSIEEWSYKYYQKESKSFNFGDFLTSLYMSPFSAIAGMIDTGKYTIAELSYDVNEKIKGKGKITNKSSNIESKEKVKLESGTEINIKASNITGNEFEKSALKTNIISGQDKETTITEKKDTKLKVGVEITNAYLNAYKAVDNVTKAGEAQARAEEELSRIEELHKQGKASDTALKQAQDNVTIARVNIAFLTTMSAGAVFGSVSSYGTLGFGIGGTATYETNETKTTQETITNIATNLIANKNIIINTNEYNQIGSNIASLAGDIFIKANKANILASKDIFNSLTENKSYNMSVSYGTAGTYGAIGYNQSSQEQYAERHNNSIIQADNGKVDINTTKETTLKGANIKGGEVLISAENLIIESLQDKSKTNGKNFGINAGIGIKGGQIGSGTAGFESGSTDNERAWVNNQSSIIGKNEVTIKVKDTTNVKGAVIASETENLTLDTGKLNYSDIKDYDTQHSSNIGINLSLGEYDNDSVLRTGLAVDATGTKVTIKEQGQEKEQETKATIGKGTIIVNNKEQTEEDLQDLNRDVNNSQTLTKEEITAALDAELNVDIKLLTSLFDAVYSGAPNRISVVKDYNKAKDKINEIKQKIQEKLKEKRRTEIEKNIKKIKFSKEKEKQQEIEKNLLLDEEIQKLQIANDNKKVLKEYLKKNKLRNEVIEQIEKIGATGEYYYGINGKGEIYALRSTGIETDTQYNVFLSIGFSYDITRDERFLSISISESYEEIYATTLSEARKSMTEILLETSPELRNISKDTNQVVKDTNKLILEMAKSSGDKETYKTALKAIKEIPNNIKETFYTTAQASNVETLQQVGYNIGDRVYDYKENPLLLAKDATSLLISYDMYKSGFNNENMFYASGLIAGGLVLDIAGLPIKTGKGVVKTTNAINKLDKINDTTKVINESKLFTDGAISKYPETKLYQYNATTNPGPLVEMGRIGSEPIKNFYGGYYNEIIAERDIILYRAGTISEPKGSWFTSVPPTSIANVRIDSAVKPFWTDINGYFISSSPIDTIFEIKIPKGTVYYEGPIANQGYSHLGGLSNKQIFIPIQYRDSIEVIEKKIIGK